MTDLFSIIVKLGLAGSYAIVFVLIVRLFLRKSPKIFSYVLWSIVFFRLICPVSLTTNFSIVPESITYPERIELTENEVSAADQISEPLWSMEDSLTFESFASSVQTSTLPFTLMDVFSAIWGFGVFILWGYSITSFATLKRKLSSARHIENNIYESNEIETPFVLGILHPRIYLPMGIQSDELEYIIMHERVHIQRKDHLLKPAAFMIVCLHWFNPFVWSAWFCMSRDMEMSCDEAVLRKMGPSIKKDYSLSLLKMASQKNSLNASPLAFSDHNAQNRILNVLSYKRPAFWMIALFAAVLTFLTLGLSTNKYKSPELKSALHHLAPYLEVKPDDVEIISETKEKELTIYQLSRQGDFIDNTFFLVFRDGRLEDAYFHPEAHQKPEFYSVDALDQIAVQYVKDVYQMEVQFENHLHLGKLYNYGLPSKHIGAVVHFTSKLEDQIVSVSISTTNGDILASSIHQLWDKNWKSAYEKGSEDGYSLLVCDDYVILTKAKQAIELYPLTRSKDKILFDKQFIYDNQEDFTLQINNKEILFSALTPSIDGGFYENRLSQRIHADASTQVELSWYISKLLGEYRSSNDRESFLDLKMDLFSSYALHLIDTQKADLNKQLKTQLSIMDEIISQNPNAYASTKSSIEGNCLTHHISWSLRYQSSETETFDGWTEINTLILEDGKFRIKETLTIPSEAFWKTTACSHPEQLGDRFVQALKYKDLSAIYEMMPYQETAVEQAKEFLQLEIKNPVLDSVNSNDTTATAIVSFNTLTHFTDEMKTTSANQMNHILQLHMLKTDAGWILNEISH